MAVTQFIQEEYTPAQLNIAQALKIEPANESYLELALQLQKRLPNPPL